MLGALACGRGAPAPASAANEQVVLPLLDLVPEGPSRVLSASPKLLAQAEATRALWRAVVPVEREQAFVTRTAVEPLALDELVIIDLPDEAFLLLARGPFDAPAVVRMAGERLAVPDVSVDKPRMRREGLAGVGRYAFAALDAHSLLVARDAPPELVAQVLARADAPSPHGAFDLPLSADLRREQADAPLVLYELKPLHLPLDTPVGVLLAEQRALAISVKPSADQLDVVVDLRGELPQGAEINLRTWARNIGATDLGRVLGLSRVSEEMAIRVDASGALVRFRVFTADLISGVRILFFDEMRRIFE